MVFSNGIAYFKNMNKIIITGPECSGKTSLSKGLSKHFKSPLIEEYARKYISSLKKKYTEDDLLKIAKKQWKKEYSLKHEKNVFCDTDLLTIKIWSEFKYNNCNSWILEKIQEQRNEKRYYLLCKPNIKWKFDSQRENKFDRDSLFKIYQKELELHKYNYFIIDNNQRLEQAKNNIKHFFN